MSETTDRLEKLIAERGIRKVDFKRDFGVTPQNYTHWKNRGIPNNEVLKLADYFNVDANWLATGIESKYSEAEQALVALNAKGIELSGVKMGLLADLMNLIKLDIDLDDACMIQRVILNTQSRYEHKAA